MGSYLRPSTTFQHQAKGAIIDHFTGFFAWVFLNAVGETRDPSWFNWEGILRRSAGQEIEEGRREAGDPKVGNGRGKGQPLLTSVGPSEVPPDKVFL